MCGRFYIRTNIDTRIRVRDLVARLRYHYDAHVVLQAIPIGAQGSSKL